MLVSQVSFLLHCSLGPCSHLLGSKTEQAITVSCFTIEMRGLAFCTIPGDGAELVHFTLMKNIPEVYIWSHSGVKDDCRECSLVARKSHLKVK